MNKHIYSWEEYYNLIYQLAKKIEPHIDHYDQLLCLARGGLILGDAFSRIFDIPLSIMFTSSYRIAEKQGELFIDDQIAKQTNNLGNKILLLDDLVDSGVTINKVVHHLKSHQNIHLVHTATIWYKKTSQHLPNYFVREANDEWIVQPFENINYN